MGAADVLVGVEDVHVAGAGRVGRPRDRPREVGVLEQSVDGEDLAWLEVQADLYGEARIAFEAI